MCRCVLLLLLLLLPSAAAPRPRSPPPSPAQHDGRLDKSSYPLPTDRPTLLDQYEYAMHGTVYEVKPKTDGKVEVSCSFGGLLMLIVGESQHVSRLEPDMEVYFLCKKLEVVL